MKKANDFKKAVAEFQIGFWPTYRCSMCGSRSGFVFDYKDEGEYAVLWSRVCMCEGMHFVSDSSWYEVADFYNKQEDKRTIMEMDIFWHFNKPMNGVIINC